LSGQDYFIYHAYPAAGTVYLGRESVLDQITWSNDGWPIINSGEGPSGGSNNSSTKQLAFIDNFDQSHLNPNWQWPVHEHPQLELRRGVLTIDPSHDNTPVFVACRLVAPIYTATVGIAERGGLGVIGGSNSEIVLSFNGNHLELWQLSNRTHKVLWQSEIPKASVAWVGATSTDPSKTTFSYSLDDKHWIPAGPSLSVTELLPWDQGLRVGLVSVGEAPAHFTKFSLTSEETR
jgi:hypothetical protein